MILQRYLMLLCQLGVGPLGARAVAFPGHRELAQGNLSRRPSSPLKKSVFRIVAY